MLIAQWLAALALDSANNIARRRHPAPSRYAAEMLESRTLLSAAPVFFHPQSTVTVGTDPQAVAVGDMNGDGIPDVVVANFGDNTVGVMLGKGDGTFGAETAFACGLNPNGIVVADFNGDGHEDVAVADRGGNDVGILLNDGTGKLTLQPALACGLTPRNIAVGDFNGDGIPDLVVANLGSNTFSTFLGVGDGTFLAATTTSTLGEPIGIAVGDFNGDGKLDVVVTNLDVMGLSISPGNGNGTFGIASVTNLAVPATSVAVADINGDGKADLVVANYTADSVTFLPGRGDTTFAGPETFDTGTGSTPAQIALADVNGDGKLDIVVDTGESAVGTLLGGGSAVFAPIQTVATGSSPGEMAVADVNGDGAPDIIAPNFDDATVSVLLNDPPPALISIDRATPTDAQTQSTDVTFTAKFTELVGNVTAQDFTVNLGTGMTSDSPILTPIGDFNSTYNIEVNHITGNGSVSLTMSDDAAIVNDAGEGLKGFVQLNPEPVVGPQTNDIAIADLNHDGRPDVIVADGEFNSIGVDLGQGGGVLTEHVDYTTGVNSAPDALAVGDLNGDGKLDVVAADSGSDEVSVFIGNGDGTVQPQVTYALDPNSGAGDIKLADINGDGILDAIVANTGNNTIGILEGKGDGTFKSEQTLATGSSPDFLAIGDFNGDGAPDIAVANQLDQTVGVFLHSGPFVGILLGLPYHPQITFPAGGFAKGMVTADLNGDHKADLLVDDGDHVAFLAGDGTGSFAAPVSSPAANGLGFMALADMNGDNIPDLVGSDDSDNIAILLGNGDGTYQHEQSFNETLSFHTVAVTDMNADGKPDIIAAGDRVQANQIFFSVGVILNVNSTSFTSDSFTILKRDATLTTTGADAIFDGNPHGATVTATGAQGEDLTSLASLSYTNTADSTTSTAAPTQPGTYEVFATFAGNDSYNAIASFDTGKQVVISPLSQLQSVPTGNLPVVPLVSGHTIKPIHFAVKLNNTAATIYAKSVTVEAVLSSSPSGTPEDPMIGQISKTVNLKAHKTGAFGSILVKSIPAGLSGTMNVLFKLTDADGGANLISAGTVTIVAASNDLAALSATVPAKAHIGKKIATTVGVIQNGNLPLVGTLSAELFLSTTTTLDGGAIDIGPAAGHVSLQPGKHGTLHLSAVIPTSVAANSYFLIVELQPSTTPADSNATNNAIPSLKMVAVS